MRQSWGKNGQESCWNPIHSDRIPGFQLDSVNSSWNQWGSEKYCPSGPIAVSTTPRQPLSSITLPPASHSLSPPVIDARANPCFATHLHPIFTQAITDQQEKLWQQTTLDAELKEKALKVKQHITVYPWTTEDTSPTIKIFQDFTWPYLMITLTLLANVGLLEASKLGNLRIYNEDEIQDWVAIDVGYVMEVREGQCLFLKDTSLCKCIDFHKLLNLCPQPSTPHLHHHLSHECAYIHDMHIKQCLNHPLPKSPSLHWLQPLWQCFPNDWVFPPYTLFLLHHKLNLYQPCCQLPSAYHLHFPHHYCPKTKLHMSVAQEVLMIWWRLMAMLLRSGGHGLSLWSMLIKNRRPKQIWEVSLILISPQPHHPLPVHFL